MLLLLSDNIFQNLLLKKNRKAIRVSNGGTQIRTERMPVMFWIQTVCKGYQQTMKVAASKERVNCFFSDRTILILEKKMATLMMTLMVLFKPYHSKTKCQ